MATTKKKTATKSVEPIETSFEETSSISEQEGAVENTAPESEHDNEKLVAKRLILYRSRQYHEGETLPADDPEMVAAWLYYKSAAWVPKEESKAPKAAMATAEPGLFGKVSNGEKDIDGNDLVGKVPKTAQRKK